MPSAELRLEMKDPKLVLKSLEPDVEPTDRFEIDAKALGSELIIKIQAKDVAALKAAINSYLRLLQATKETMEV